MKNLAKLVVCPIAIAVLLLIIAIHKHGNGDETAPAEIIVKEEVYDNTRRPIRPEAFAPEEEEAPVIKQQQPAAMQQVAAENKNGQQKEKPDSGIRFSASFNFNN